MGRALGLRAARCEPFGRGFSRAAREQPATVGVGSARTVGGVLWDPPGTRTANGRGVRPPGSGARLEPSSADRPHLGWLCVVVAVWLPMPRRAHSVGRTVENGKWEEWFFQKVAGFVGNMSLAPRASQPPSHEIASPSKAKKNVMVDP